MKKEVLIFVVLVAAMPALGYSADLISFSAGDPIVSSELNTNFSELEARINALEAQIDASQSGVPGDLFNYSVSGSPDTLSLATGYKYYVTDVLFERGIDSSSSCGGVTDMPVISGSSLGVFIRVPPENGAGGATCGSTGRHISLGSPLLIPGGETIEAVSMPSSGAVRFIGYRAPN